MSSFGILIAEPLLFYPSPPSSIQYMAENIRQFFELENTKWVKNYYHRIQNIWVIGQSLSWTR